MRDADPVSPRSAVRNAFVTVNIIRNDFSPVFIADSCDVALTQFSSNQFFLTQVSATDGDNPVGALNCMLIYSIYENIFQTYFQLFC